MQSQNQIRQEITNQIIAALEKNVLPWRRPWKGPSGRHANAVSKNAYSGINPLLLELHTYRHGFSSPYWATFRQWEGLGAKVKRRPDGVKPGQWGSRIVFCKPIAKTVIDENGQEKKESFTVLRTYTVFNVDQVEGGAADQFKEETDQKTTVPDFEPAEKLIAATSAEIRHGGGRAFYRRPLPEGSWPHHSDGDFVCVPNKVSFTPPGAYYETIFHELAHWSECRLDWSSSYSMGELIAEMASCFLSQELGIPQVEPLDNHVAYLKGWLKEMQEDSKFIFQASAQASKTTDFLLSFGDK